MGCGLVRAWGRSARVDLFGVDLVTRSARDRSPTLVVADLVDVVRHAQGKILHANVVASVYLLDIYAAGHI